MEDAFAKRVTERSGKGIEEALRKDYFERGKEVGDEDDLGVGPTDLAEGRRKRRGRGGEVEVEGPELAARR